MFHSLSSCTPGTLVTTYYNSENFHELDIDANVTIQVNGVVRLERPIQINPTELVKAQVISPAGYLQHVFYEYTIDAIPSAFGIVTRNNFNPTVKVKDSKLKWFNYLNLDPEITFYQSNEKFPTRRLVGWASDYIDVEELHIVLDPLNKALSFFSSSRELICKVILPAGPIDYRRIFKTTPEGTYRQDLIVLANNYKLYKILFDKRYYESQEFRPAVLPLFMLDDLPFQQDLPTGGSFLDQARKKFLSQLFPTVMALDVDGNTLWIAGSDKVYVLDSNFSLTSSFTIPGEEINAVACFNGGLALTTKSHKLIWVSSGSMLILYSSSMLGSPTVYDNKLVLPDSHNQRLLIFSDLSGSYQVWSTPDFIPAYVKTFDNVLYATGHDSIHALKYIAPDVYTKITFDRKVTLVSVVGQSILGLHYLEKYATLDTTGIKQIAPIRFENRRGPLTHIGTKPVQVYNLGDPGIQPYPGPRISVWVNGIENEPISSKDYVGVSYRAETNGTQRSCVIIGDQAIDYTVVVETSRRAEDNFSIGTKNLNLLQSPSTSNLTVSFGDIKNGTTVVPLPFLFKIYNKKYSSINVSTNGYITFGNNFAVNAVSVNTNVVGSAIYVERDNLYQGLPINNVDPLNIINGELTSKETPGVYWRINDLENFTELRIKWVGTSMRFYPNGNTLSAAATTSSLTKLPFGKESSFYINDYVSGNNISVSTKVLSKIFYNNIAKIIFTDTVNNRYYLRSDKTIEPYSEIYWNSNYYGYVSSSTTNISTGPRILSKISAYNYIIDTDVSSQFADPRATIKCESVAIGSYHFLTNPITVTTNTTTFTALRNFSGSRIYVDSTTTSGLLNNSTLFSSGTIPANTRLTGTGSVTRTLTVAKAISFNSTSNLSTLSFTVSFTNPEYPVQVSYQLSNYTGTADFFNNQPYSGFVSVSSGSTIISFTGNSQIDVLPQTFNFDITANLVPNTLSTVSFSQDIILGNLLLIDPQSQTTALTEYFLNLSQSVTSNVIDTFSFISTDVTFSAASNPITDIQFINGTGLISFIENYVTVANASVDLAMHTLASFRGNYAIVDQPVSLTLNDQITFKANVPTQTVTYEAGLYSGGIFQYIELNYPSTTNHITANIGIRSSGYANITLSNTAANNSYVFSSYSSTGNWQYLGVGSFLENINEYNPRLPRVEKVLTPDQNDLRYEFYIEHKIKNNSNVLLATDYGYLEHNGIFYNGFGNNSYLKENDLIVLVLPFNTNKRAIAPIVSIGDFQFALPSVPESLYNNYSRNTTLYIDQPKSIKVTGNCTIGFAGDYFIPEYYVGTIGYKNNILFKRTRSGNTINLTGRVHNFVNGDIITVENIKTSGRKYDYRDAVIAGPESWRIAFRTNADPIFNELNFDVLDQPFVRAEEFTYYNQSIGSTQVEEIFYAHRTSNIELTSNVGLITSNLYLDTPGVYFIRDGNLLASTTFITNVSTGTNIALQRKVYNYFESNVIIYQLQKDTDSSNVLIPIGSWPINNKTIIQDGKQITNSVFSYSIEQLYKAHSAESTFEVKKKFYDSQTIITYNIDSKFTKDTKNLSADIKESFLKQSTLPTQPIKDSILAYYTKFYFEIIEDEIPLQYSFVDNEVIDGILLNNGTYSTYQIDVDDLIKQSILATQPIKDSILAYYTKFNFEILEDEIPLQYSFVDNEAIDAILLNNGTYYTDQIDVDDLIQNLLYQLDFNNSELFNYSEFVFNLGLPDRLTYDSIMTPEIEGEIIIGDIIKVDPVQPFNSEPFTILNFSHTLDFLKPDTTITFTNANQLQNLQVLLFGYSTPTLIEISSEYTFSSTANFIGANTIQKLFYQSKLLKPTVDYKINHQVPFIVTYSSITGPESEFEFLISGQQNFAFNTNDILKAGTYTQFDGNLIFQNPITYLFNLFFGDKTHELGSYLFESRTTRLNPYTSTLASLVASKENIQTEINFNNNSLTSNRHTEFFVLSVFNVAEAFNYNYKQAISDILNTPSVLNQPNISQNFTENSLVLNPIIMKIVTEVSNLYSKFDASRVDLVDNFKIDNFSKISDLVNDIRYLMTVSIAISNAGLIEFDNSEGLLPTLITNILQTNNYQNSVLTTDVYVELIFAIMKSIDSSVMKSIDSSADSNQDLNFKLQDLVTLSKQSLEFNIINSTKDLRHDLNFELQDLVTLSKKSLEFNIINSTKDLRHDLNFELQDLITLAKKLLEFDIINSTQDLKHDLNFELQDPLTLANKLLEFDFLTGGTNSIHDLNFELQDLITLAKKLLNFDIINSTQDLKHDLNFELQDLITLAKELLNFDIINSTKDLKHDLNFELQDLLTLANKLPEFDFVAGGTNIDNSSDFEFQKSPTQINTESGFVSVVYKDSIIVKSDFKEEPTVESFVIDSGFVSVVYKDSIFVKSDFKEVPAVDSFGIDSGFFLQQTPTDLLKEQQFLTFYTNDVTFNSHFSFFESNDIIFNFDFKRDDIESPITINQEFYRIDPMDSLVFDSNFYRDDSIDSLIFDSLANLIDERDSIVRNINPFYQLSLNELIQISDFQLQESHVAYTGYLDFSFVDSQPAITRNINPFYQYDLHQLIQEIESLCIDSSKTIVSNFGSIYIDNSEPISRNLTPWYNQPTIISNIKFSSELYKPSEIYRKMVFFEIPKHDIVLAPEFELQQEQHWSYSERNTYGSTQANIYLFATNKVWSRYEKDVTVTAEADEGEYLHLVAPTGYIFKSVEFASYGLPEGSPGTFIINPEAHAPGSLEIVKGIVLGAVGNVAIKASSVIFGDPVTGIKKKLVVTATAVPQNRYKMQDYPAVDMNAGIVGAYNDTIIHTFITNGTINFTQPTEIEVLAVGGGGGGGGGEWQRGAGGGAGGLVAGRLTVPAGVVNVFVGGGGQGGQGAEIGNIGPGPVMGGLGGTNGGANGGNGLGISGGGGGGGGFSGISVNNQFLLVAGGGAGGGGAAEGSINEMAASGGGSQPGGQNTGSMNGTVGSAYIDGVVGNGTKIFGLKDPGLSGPLNYPIFQAYYGDFLIQHGVWEADPSEIYFSRTYTVNFPISGNYLFAGSVDDSGNVFLDGNQVLQIVDYAIINSKTIPVSAGNHTVQIVAQNSAGVGSVAFTIEIPALDGGGGGGGGGGYVGGLGQSSNSINRRSSGGQNYINPSTVVAMANINGNDSDSQIGGSPPVYASIGYHDGNKFYEGYSYPGQLTSPASSAANSVSGLIDATSLSWGTFLNSYGVTNPDLNGKSGTMVVKRTFVAPASGNYKIEYSADETISIKLNGNVIVSTTASSATTSSIVTTFIQAGIHVFEFTVTKASTSPYIHAFYIGWGSFLRSFGITDPSIANSPGTAIIKLPITFPAAGTYKFVYSSDDGLLWTITGVTTIVSNPNYTGGAEIPIYKSVPAGTYEMQFRLTNGPGPSGVAAWIQNSQNEIIFDTGSAIRTLNPGEKGGFAVTIRNISNRILWDTRTAKPDSYVNPDLGTLLSGSAYGGGKGGTGGEITTQFDYGGGANGARGLVLIKYRKPKTYSDFVFYEQHYNYAKGSFNAYAAAANEAKKFVSSTPFVIPGTDYWNHRVFFNTHVYAVPARPDAYFYETYIPGIYSNLAVASRTSAIRFLIQTQDLNDGTIIPYKITSTANLMLLSPNTATIGNLTIRSDRSYFDMSLINDGGLADDIITFSITAQDCLANANVNVTVKATGVAAGNLLYDFDHCQVLSGNIGLPAIRGKPVELPGFFSKKSQTALPEFKVDNASLYERYAPYVTDSSSVPLASRFTHEQEVQEYSYRSSAVKVNNWIPGASFIPGYTISQNITVENIVRTDRDPWNRINPLIETRANIWVRGNSSVGGGYNTVMFNIDHTKVYRSSVWVRSTATDATGYISHGIITNGSHPAYPNTVSSIGNVIRVNDNKAEFDPFWSIRYVGDYEKEVWYCHIAYIYGSGYTGNVEYPGSGIYTRGSGLVYRNNGNCVAGKFPANATQAMQRVLFSDSIDNTTIVQFAFPRFEEVTRDTLPIDLLIDYGPYEIPQLKHDAANKYVVARRKTWPVMWNTRGG